MKRAITGIVAAGLALGMMAPAAFAATSSSYQLSAAGGKTISVDGSALYTGVQAATAVDAGSTTTYFPIWYLEQALTKAGYVNTYDPSTNTWNLQMPGVNAANVSVDGGVGSGNAAIAINGIVVKKFNAAWHKDFAGGANAAVTTYFPIYYLGNVLSAAGFTNAWNGSSFGFESTYGQATALTLSPASANLVADNASTDTVTLNVVDANGHIVRNYSGDVTVSAPANGTLEDMSGNALAVSSGVVTVPVTNGTAQVKLVSNANVAGSSDTLTATFTPPGAANTVSTSATISYVAPMASAVGLSIESGQPSSISVNDATTPTYAHVVLNDQGGNAMASGGAYVTLSLSGPGSFVSGSQITTYTAWVGPTGANVPVYGEQGVSGTIAVTATSAGLTGASLAIPAVVNTAAAGVHLSSTTGTDANGNEFTLYTATLVDSNGNIVDNSTDTVGITDNASTGGGALSYFYGSGLNSGVPVAGSGTTAPTALTFTHGVAQFAVETTTVGTDPVTLTATESGNSFTTTAPYSYQVGTASKVEPVTGEVAQTVTAGHSVSISMQLEDGNGNAVASAGQSVVFNLAQGGTSATFSNGNTQTYTATTDANGVATVTINVPSGSTTGAFSVTASYNGGTASSAVTGNVVDAANYATSMSWSGGTAWSPSTTTAVATNIFSTPGVALANAVGSAVSSNDVIQISSSNSSVVSLGTGTGWTADPTNSNAEDYTLSSASTLSLPTLTAGMAGTATITVKDLSNPSVPVLTETLSVTPSTQSAEWVEYQGQQVSTSNPLTVSANTPVALTVANVDAAGNLLPVTSTQAGTNSYITVNLSDTNGGAYTLVPGGAPVTSVEIPVGQTSVTVYYVNATAKTITGGLTAQ